MTSHSSGSGPGSGPGSGSGFGFGFGSGFGFTEIGTIGDHAIEANRYGVVRIGCQAHTIAWWRDNYRQVAAAALRAWPDA